jgi:hypothetical protein
MQLGLCVLHAIACPTVALLNIEPLELESRGKSLKMAEKPRAFPAKIIDPKGSMLSKATVDEQLSVLYYQ